MILEEDEYIIRWSQVYQISDNQYNSIDPWKSWEY